MIRRLWRWLRSLFVIPQPETHYAVAGADPAPVSIPVPAPVSRIPQLADFTTTLAAWRKDWRVWNEGTTMIYDPNTNAVRIEYSTAGGALQSNDQVIEYNTARRYRYDDMLMVRGTVNIISSPGTEQRTRKLIDLFVGGEPNCRVILARDNMHLVYYVCQFESDGLWHADKTWADTGIVLADGAPHDLALMLRCNSADGVRDGVLHILCNGASHVVESLSPISERGSTFFQSCRVGTQLTTQAEDGPSHEYRWWWDAVVMTR